MSTKFRGSLTVASDQQTKVYDSGLDSHGAGIWAYPFTENGKLWLEKLRLGLRTESASYTYLIQLCAVDNVGVFPSTGQYPLNAQMFTGGDTELAGQVITAPYSASHKVLLSKYIMSNGSPFQWVAAARKDMMYFTWSQGHELFLRIRFPASELNALKVITDANEPRLALELYGEVS